MKSIVYKKIPLPKYVFFQEGTGLRTWQWTSSGMKVINVTNILGDDSGSVDANNTDKFISQNEFESRYRHFEVQNGDIVVASSGNTYGKVGRIKRSNLPLMMNTSVIRFHSKDKNILNDDYLYCFLRSSYFKNQIEKYVIGGAQPNFGPTHLKKMFMPMPKISEQLAIANNITTYDKYLENNCRRIQLLEESAWLLYREWFVYLHFPGNEKLKKVDNVPAGWEKGFLGDITKIKKGKNITFEQAIEGEVPVIGGGLEPTYFHNKANVCAPVVTVSASGANAGYVNLYYSDVWASDCSYMNKETTKYIFYLFLMLKSLQAYISGMQVGVAQPHVYPKDLIRLKILIPPEDLRKRFELLVTPIFDLIKILKHQNQKLAQARDLLLPRLMSGKIKV
ncbi:MAG: restriction endonuclease subunit S [Candidatus Omnitrophota bacterium]